MNRKHASDFPQDLLTLFDRYVHGEISRRDFFERAQKFAVGGLTAAALFEMLKPNYAWAIQVPKDDSRIKAEWVTVPSPQGNGTIKGYLVRPASAPDRLPGVLVVHENRGLNPYIEDVARRVAIAGFMALAPDGLTSVGGYPGDDEKGGALFKEVDHGKMLEDFLAAATWLKSTARLHRQNRRHRFLFRRWRREPTRRPYGRRLGGRGAVLRGPAERWRSGEDQSAGDWRITPSSTRASPRGGRLTMRRFRRLT